MSTTASTSAPGIDFDAVANLEHDYYTDGYREGYHHGALHGTFEGRRLGAEKGYELWSEIGVIEAFARTWLDLVAAPLHGNTSLATLDGTISTPRKRQKQQQQLESLLLAVDAFPIDNADIDFETGAALDRLRAKYKLACFSLGVPADGNVETDSQFASGSSSIERPLDGVVIKGRSVDTSQLHF